MFGKARNGSALGPLGRACRSQFSSKDWYRGADYASSGAVSFRSTAGYTLLADVFGSEIDAYRVAVSLKDSDGYAVIAVSCSCPRYESHGVCKHLAATIIAADRFGYTSSWDLSELNDDWDEADGEYLDPHNSVSITSRATKPSPIAKPVAPPPPTWSQHLAEIARTQGHAGQPFQIPSARKKFRRLIYVIDIARSVTAGRISISFMHQDQMKNGDFGAAKTVRQTLEELHAMHSAEDHEIIDRLIGSDWKDSYYSMGVNYYSRVSQCQLAPSLTAEHLARICATGRCMIAPNTDRGTPELKPAVWDDGPPWQFKLNWAQDAKRKAWVAEASFQRVGLAGEEESIDLAKADAIFSLGILIVSGRIARMEPLGPQAMAWIKFLQSKKQLVVPENEFPDFTSKFYETMSSVELELPQEYRWPVVQSRPEPCVRIREFKNHFRKDLLLANTIFRYDDFEVEPTNPAARVADEKGHRLIVRDLAEEARRFQELRLCGFTQLDRYYAKSESDMQLLQKKLAVAVDALARLGWLVEAEGMKIRRPGKFNISVTSGVDWFDLNVECDFDGIKAALPDLLAAIEKGEQFVLLDDGTHGMLPHEWLKKYAPLAEFGKADGDSLRFLPSQAMILDALLAAQPDADIDASFRKVREKLRSFDGVKAMQEPASFQGTLREYQREGLGWVNFLREFNCGGCLADDMGLGKTVQVLALLEGIRAGRSGKKSGTMPSLVVAPKSLVFNWMDEAARFAPELKVLNYTGLERKASADSLTDHDLILTTYGTLRRDFVEFRKIEFNYAILDEAQAIKNPTSQSAKACRLLQAKHRLAMTGTPVENHLGDLWSLFEFLNPGMLGHSNSLSAFSGRKSPDAESIELLARALRPFLLRRTKEQVLKELPEKTEQTLFCEMEPKQRRMYNDLRDYYRALLAKKIEEVGLAKAKIHVLEALLRLRQAACHPALIDKAKTKAKLPSAKLDALLEQLTEVIEEHHKVLVFSQFTSFLALVKPALDERGIRYEYLDGQTNDRKSCVKRFQEDPDCRAFLISLKAGGHGLNLTAADYVFILDPWWNPAVEMQAVDRAHRIGQTKPVFAYRLIARDTVEEKILELQKQKRTLAEAVISADENLLRTLTAEDLQLLLS